MKVQIDPHTLERAEERGTDEDEIKDVIKQDLLFPLNMGRQEELKFMISRENDTANIMNKRELRYSMLSKEV